MAQTDRDAGAAQTASAPRKRPEQQRSKQRLEDILSAASQLIAKTGSDKVRMSDVAALAGISIGSLYQYFPAKAALIRTLAERYNAESRECIELALAGVHDVDSLVDAYADLVDQYYAIMMAEPVMRDIWSGMQADRELMACQLAESRLCSAMLAAAMRKARPQANPQMIDVTAFLVWEMGEATVRLAISVGPEEGQGLIDAYKRMTLREIAGH